MRKTKKLDFESTIKKLAKNYRKFLFIVKITGLDTWKNGWIWDLKNSWYSSTLRRSRRWKLREGRPFQRFLEVKDSQETENFLLPKNKPRHSEKEKTKNKQSCTWQGFEESFQACFQLHPSKIGHHHRCCFNLLKLDFVCDTLRNSC